MINVGIKESEWCMIIQFSDMKNLYNLTVNLRKHFNFISYKIFCIYAYPLWGKTVSFSHESWLNKKFPISGYGTVKIFTSQGRPVYIKMSCKKNEWKSIQGHTPVHWLLRDFVPRPAYSAHIALGPFPNCFIKVFELTANSLHISYIVCKNVYISGACNDIYFHFTMKC